MWLSKLARSSVEYRMALVNAGIFLLASLGVSIVQPDSLVFVLLPNVIFMMGSFVSWALMMNRGWVLSPIGWYVLGGGLFFGFGVIAGGLHVHPWADAAYGNDLGYLLQVNVLNAVSVFLVLLTSSWFVRNSDGISRANEGVLEEAIKKILPLRLFFLLCFLTVVLKLVFFPDVDSLVVRSILAKAYFLFPAVFLLAGLMAHRMKWVDRFLLFVIFVLQLVNGALLHNKYEILMPIIALIIGVWSSARSYKLILATLIVPLIVFWIANPIVSLSRLHYKYSPVDNTVADRVVILWDVFNATYLEPEKPLNPVGEARGNLDIPQRMTLQERIRAIGVRFDVASIEGFLIKEYNEGRPGNSLEDFWAVLVPRVLWPDKPIITRFGNELNVKYYNNDIVHATSAMAPTYSGEAYWNYGWIGVFLVSIYLGIVFGIFTQIGLNAARGADVAYLFVAYPLLVSAAFVESWITATYIGGIVITVLYYIAIKAALSLIARGQKSA